jgi:PHD/YefM family antitoxin component YafN of YafNO toxin-antitoxin module
MTISTTYFREHLAEVITQVADGGQEVILVFGKGKNAKKISLNEVNTVKEASKKQNSLLQFSKSDYFKNHKVNPKYQEAKNFKEIMDKYYDLNDFVV